MAGYIGANTSSVTNNQNAAERRKKFTFTTNTTALTGLNFLPNKIHIFHNGIRLVKIGNVDLQPCGGTHVKSTKEIGNIKIGKIENKGKMNRRVNLSISD